MTDVNLKEICVNPVAVGDIDVATATISQSKSRGSLIPAAIRVGSHKEKLTNYVVNTDTIKEHLVSGEPLPFGDLNLVVKKLGEEKLIFESVTDNATAQKLVRDRAKLDNAVGWDAQRHVHVCHVLQSGDRIDVVITTLNPSAKKKLK